MPVMTLRLFDAGAQPLRTERLTVADASEAIAVARSRLKSSRFKRATIHLDGVYLVRLGSDGLPGGPQKEDGPVPAVVRSPEP